MFWNPSERVYLNAGEDFFPADTLDFLELVDKVYRGEPLCKQDAYGRVAVFYRRTKKCIVKETNRFIDGLNEVVADESAISHVSITQVNKLIRALKNRRGRITCYALILMHVCLSLIYDNYDSNLQINQDMILRCMRIIHALVESYYAENADPLAHFLLQCSPVVFSEINLDWTRMQLNGVKAFPPIPKRNPRSLDD